MYSVLYAVTPEVIPANHRGTGNGLTGAATRFFGVLVRSFQRQLVLQGLTYVQAPIIALYANLDTAVPVYIAGGLLIGSGSLALLLPFEPRGKASI